MGGIRVYDAVVDTSEIHEHLCAYPPPGNWRQHVQGRRPAPHKAKSASTKKKAEFSVEKNEDNWVSTWNEAEFFSDQLGQCEGLPTYHDWSTSRGGYVCGQNDVTT